MKTLVINPYMFTNIKIMEFNNVAFTFDNNEDFISFLSNNKKVDPFISTNVSYLKIPPKTDFTKIEEFCKLQRKACIVEIEIDNKLLDV